MLWSVVGHMLMIKAIRAHGLRTGGLLRIG